MNSVSPDLTSRTLGNWSLIRLLGEGGFGAVYEAEHRTIKGRRAAVKVLHPHLAFHKDIKRRFITEASIASQAEHEHIVQVFDGGVSEDGVCYVAMELLRGQSLASLLRQEKRLSTDRAIKIALQIISALEVAHSLGVVHRDLKPDNVFLCQKKSTSDFVKVLDFGIAKLQTSDSNTTSGAVLGTPLYMSPEQWQTLPDIDGRSDLYALGIILFQCVTGTLPYDGPNSFAVMMAHMQAAVPDASKLASVPPELNDLIRCLMAKERGDRPNSARKVGNALRRILGLELESEEDVNLLGATPVAQQRPSRSSKSLSLRQHSGELASNGRTRRLGYLAIPIVAALGLFYASKSSLFSLLSSPRPGKTMTDGSYLPMSPSSVTTSSSNSISTANSVTQGAVLRESVAPPDMSTTLTVPSVSPAAVSAPKAKVSTQNKSSFSAKPVASRPTVQKATVPSNSSRKSDAQDLYEVPLVR